MFAVFTNYTRTHRTKDIIPLAPIERKIYLQHTVIHLPHPTQLWWPSLRDNIQYHLSTKIVQTSIQLSMPATVYHCKQNKNTEVKKTQRIPNRVLPTHLHATQTEFYWGVALGSRRDTKHAPNNRRTNTPWRRRSANKLFHHFVIITTSVQL